VPLFSRSKGLVGLDLGSSAVKAVELRDLGKGRGHQLVNVGVEPLPSEAIVDGAIMDSGLVADAIQRLFSTHKFKAQDVAISLSGHSVIIKKIALPVMTPEELAESIQWEAEQYIPFDMDDVNIDYQVLGASDATSDGNMDVLLVAVKKDKINDYTSVVSQAGRNPVVVDVDVFALQNAFESSYESHPAEVVGLINLGASVTNISVLMHGASIFWRDISIGGNRYTEAIQRELNLPQEQAEALKRGDTVEGIPTDNVLPIITAVNEEVGNEIQKTLDFFKATTSGEPVQHLILSGGCSRAPNLTEYMSERFQTPVEVFNPLRRLGDSERVAPGAEGEEMAPSLAVAVGLALRTTGDKE
jgi:type IV pilus assembly protein PilM